MLCGTCGGKGQLVVTEPIQWKNICVTCQGIGVSVCVTDFWCICLCYDLMLLFAGLIVFVLKDVFGVGHVEAKASLVLTEPIYWNYFIYWNLFI